MAMAAFASRCLEVAATEKRSLTFRGHSDLPDGQYGFLEMYCDEVGCDCRRVVLQVRSPDPSSPIWATINFGWESEAYYVNWMKNKDLAREACGANLDPLNPNSPLAPVLLDMFVNVVADDAYVERLKRRYALFKASLSGRVAAASSTTTRMPLKKLKGIRKRRL